MTGCQRCGTELAPAARFCSECGTPRHVEPAAAAEERKIVSVLFCDLVGFTARSDAADPEDVRARIRPYHVTLRQEIERLGGTVEKFIGDAVMAVFGAPVTREDDAERAVRVGLRLLDAIADLNAAEPGIGLAVRIGIETGEAVVALGARPELGEGLVTGDVVNTASRLQGAAPAGGLVIGSRTSDAVAGIFDTEPLPPAVVKGKSEPVALWRVRAARSRLGVGVARNHTIPMVGRELELVMLTSIFDRSVRDRSAQLVTLVAEPGAGKSRLVAELGLAIDVRPELVRWRQGNCLSYGDGITFWALGEIVKAHAGILDSDDAARAAEKLAGAVAVDAADRDWLLARLGPLVGLDTGAGAGREESFVAWRRFCESLAGDGPLVLVVEDLHWADDALLDFLEHLAAHSSGVPMMIIGTARPELFERRPAWSVGQRNTTTVNLAPLSDDETGRLVADLLDSGEVDPALRALVVERAGGNPLYAEQFARSLRGAGPAAGALLPHSVQALVAARLDTLPARQKALLQNAAVLGRAFWAGAVAAMSDRDEQEVRDDLYAAARKELVRPSRDSSMAAEQEYTFWHGLLRDVCYGQIPRASRVQKHRRAAAWIEKHAAGRVEDVADLLAHHHSEAIALEQAAGGVPDEPARDHARRFLLLAGDRAMGLDVARAEAAYARALELTPPSHPRWPTLLARSARAAHRAGRLADAEARYRDAIRAFRAAGDPADAGTLLVALAALLYNRGDDRHEHVAEEARVLLAAEPGPALVDAHVQLAASRFAANDRSGAQQQIDRGLALADRLGLAAPIRGLAMRGMLRFDHGDVGGLDDIRAAAERADSEGDFDTASRQRMNLANLQRMTIGPARALADLRAAGLTCDRRGLTEASMMIRTNALDLRIACGEWAAAARDAATLAVELDAVGAELWLLGVRSSELMAATLLGQGSDAGAVDRLVQAGRRSGEAQMVAHLFHSAAHARLAAGDVTGAHDLLVELTGVPEIGAESTMVPFVPGLVRIAVACGDPGLGARLAGLLDAITSLHEHALVTAEAVLAEARGDRLDAAERFADAARRWRAFGDVTEHVHALLGWARCAPDPLVVADHLDGLLDGVESGPLLGQIEALRARQFCGSSTNTGISRSVRCW